MVAQKVGYFMETEEKKIYTIEDIARELGVSKTTVSRAISGKGRISQATRDRVRAFIKEHDYRPNVVAKGLAQRKTYNIALLMPKDYVATEFLFFKDCMNGICEVASAHDYDIIISTEERKEKDKRIVVIPNILNETGISTLRAHLDNMNSIMIENATPFSPECFILFSPEFIFTDLEVKTKEECLKIMSQAMEEKHVVTEDFYDSVMDRESKTTTTIGNGVSLPHGSPTAVNESKVGIAILKNPIMWDNEQVQVVFLLAFRLSTRDEISRIQMFYKEYVTLIDSEEKLEKLKSMKSNIELYKYLIQ